MSKTAPSGKQLLNKVSLGMYKGAKIGASTTVTCSRPTSADMQWEHACSGNMQCGFHCL